MQNLHQNYHACEFFISLKAFKWKKISAGQTYSEFFIAQQVIFNYGVFVSLQCYFYSEILFRNFRCPANYCTKIKIKILISMNVLYDITVLGMGQQQKMSRTGVFRVVDNLAINLLQNPEVQLTLCADTAINVTDFACRYINETKSYQNAAFLYPPDYNKRLKYLNQQNLIFQKLIQNNSNIKLTEKIWLKYNLKKIQFLNKLTSTESISKKDIQKYSIYHSPFFAISNNIKSTGLKSIFLTVYDLIPIKYPRFFEEKMTWSVKNALSNITPETWVFCI